MQEMQKRAGSIPGLEGSPGEGNGSPLQDSCLESPMDRGAWRAAVRVVARIGHHWTRAHCAVSLTKSLKKSKCSRQVTNMFRTGLIKTRLKRNQNLKPTKQKGERKKKEKNAITCKTSRLVLWWVLFA